MSSVHIRAMLIAVLALVAAGGSEIAKASPPAGWQVFAPVRSAPVFYQPSGVAVDDLGRMYVPDASTSTLQVISRAGKSLATWGSPGSGAGQLKGPSDVAIGRDGPLFVADAGNGRVVKFSNSGTFLSSWNLGGQAPSNRAPFVIAAGPGGSILTLRWEAAGRLRLQRFSSLGSRQGSWAIAPRMKIDRTFNNGFGPEQGDLTAFPRGIAVVPRTSDGLTYRSIVVSFTVETCSLDRDETCRDYVIVQVISTRGTLQREWLARQSDTRVGWPAGLAIGSGNTVLVPLPERDAIGVYSAAGKALHVITAPQSGQFTDIGGITVGSKGNIFVVTTISQTVRELSAAGHPVAVWGGKRSDVLNFPHGLAVDSAGNVYVADTNDDAVKKIGADGLLLETWSDPDGPVAVAIAPDGHVYVTDARAGVREFSADGTQLRQWGTKGTATGQFENPEGIAVDSDGNVYVADTDNDRVQKFSATGTFETSWNGPGGSPPARFLSPFGVAVDASNNVYVADSGNGRIEKYSAAGSYLASYPVPAPPRASFAGVFPPTVAVDGAGNIFTTDGGSTVIEITPGGQSNFWGGWGLAPGQFEDAEGVALDGGGNLYVTDVDATYIPNDRIQKLHVGT